MDRPCRRNLAANLRGRLRRRKNEHNLFLVVAYLFLEVWSHWSHIASRNRMRRQGVEDIKGAIGAASFGALRQSVKLVVIAHQNLHRMVSFRCYRSPIALTAAWFTACARCSFRLGIASAFRHFCCWRSASPHGVVRNPTSGKPNAGPNHQPCQYIRGQGLVADE